MSEHEEFERERAEAVRRIGEDRDFADVTRNWMNTSIAMRYSYNFDWLGRPVIQYPQDIVATQELIWRVKPDLVIETGIARGGSLILSASILAMLDYADAVETKTVLDPAKPKRKVVGVDIDIRAHNRAALEAHPLSSRLEMIEGSSIDPAVVDQVRTHIGDGARVLVFLDSNHTHDHVLAELELYAPLVSVGSYCVAFDTVIEDLTETFPDRPWGKGDNAKTAVWKFLKKHPEFEVDKTLEHKLQITVAPDGYLRRVR